MAVMIRRFLISLLVFASLSSQVSVAFACGMMGGEHTVVVKQCCCEHPGVGGPTCDPSAKTRDCCHKVVELSAGPGDQVGGLAATVRLPPYDPQALPPVLLPAVYALALPVSAPARHWYEHSERSFYGTRLYLRTQRLRL